MFITAMLIGGCVNTVTELSDQTGITVFSETEKTKTENLFIDTLPAYDYNGHIFIIVDKSPQYNSYWYTRDVYAEVQNGDPINDAVFERNMTIEEKFNIEIKEANSSGSPEEMLSKSVFAGEDLYDLITTDFRGYSTLIPNDMLVDLNTVEEIDLSNSWWDQEMKVNLSVADKLYYITGDISIMDDMGTWCLAFNKDIINNYKMSNPYEFVDNGKWTYDVMFEMIQGATDDLDGDGKISQNDQFGFFTENYNNYTLWAASGNSIVKKDSDDLPVLSMYNDKSAAILEKVLEMQLYEGSVPAEFFTFKSITEMDLSEEYFAEGGGLFIYGGMKNISDFRASEVTFGILPAPKYDEAQTRYYNSFSFINCPAYGIPVTAEDIARTGIIFETMASVSVYTLTPAYYEICLKNKYVRDNESEKMIEIIMSTRNFDLGVINNWGGLLIMLMDMYHSKNNNFASEYEKLSSKAQTEIDKFVEIIID